LSRSRSDAYFADPNPFNETVWDESSAYFDTDLITVEQVAKARMARLATSQKTNPEHKLSKLADGFSWGEMASFFEIMADGTTGTVEKKFIEYWLSMLFLFGNVLSMLLDAADYSRLMQKTSACLRRSGGSDAPRPCEALSVLLSLRSSWRLLALPNVIWRVMLTIAR
jgi:hypothetical protein